MTHPTTTPTKTCAQCLREFRPSRPLQAVCGPVCARRIGEAKRAAQRARDRARAETLKTIPRLIKEAQREFNRWVRMRDEGRPCICCGRMAGAGELRGGEWDCGHYRSTGSASHLRFDPANAHRQLKSCNRWGAGRAVDYRIGLIARVGLVEVERLESNNTPHKWRREELTAIRDEYRARARELEKARTRHE